MIRTKAKPASISEILREEFLEPVGLPDHALIEATGMPESEIAALCDGRLAVSASLALILGRVFGNSADFWLNVQRRTDLWEAMHSPVDFDRLARATLLIAAV